ncbi:hypothetical protein pipiens_011318, partial [Culex pipiens pipiens]
GGDAGENQHIQRCTE